MIYPRVSRTRRYNHRNYPKYHLEVDDRSLVRRPKAPPGSPVPHPERTPGGVFDLPLRLWWFHTPIALFVPDRWNKDVDLPRVPSILFVLGLAVFIAQYRKDHIPSNLLFLPTFRIACNALPLVFQGRSGTQHCLAINLRFLSANF